MKTRPPHILFSAVILVAVFAVTFRGPASAAIVESKDYSGVMGAAWNGVPNYVENVGWGIDGGNPPMGYDHAMPYGDDFWMNEDPWVVRILDHGIGFSDVSDNYYPGTSEWVRVQLRSHTNGCPAGLTECEWFETYGRQNDGWFRFKVRLPRTPPLPKVRFELALDLTIEETVHTNLFMLEGFTHDVAVFSPVFRGIAADGRFGSWQHFRNPVVPNPPNHHTPPPDARPHRMLFEMDPNELAPAPGGQPWIEIEIAQTIPYTLQDRRDFWDHYLRHQGSEEVTVTEVYLGQSGLSTAPAGEREEREIVAWEIRRATDPATNVVLVTSGCDPEPPGNRASEGFIEAVIEHPEWLDHLSFIFIPTQNPDSYEWATTHVVPYGNTADTNAISSLCHGLSWGRQFALERYGHGAHADPEAKVVHAYLERVVETNTIVVQLDLNTDLTPHPARWLGGGIGPPIYGFVAYRDEADIVRVSQVVDLLTTSSGPFAKRNAYSRPYYRPFGDTNWAANPWSAPHGIPARIILEYDEMVLYRGVDRPRPAWLSSEPMISDYHGFHVDGFIDEIGFAAGGSTHYLYRMWGRELAEAVYVVYGPKSLPFDLCENWNEPSHTNGWSRFTGGAVGSPPGWEANGGLDGTGYVVCDLGELASWPAAPPVYYPLNTYGWQGQGQMHPVNLLGRPTIRVALNATPGAMLRGGTLRLFVGQWNSDEEYAFYYYEGAAFDVGAGAWLTSYETISANAADWVCYAVAGPAPPELADVLQNPQQWGFALVGAGAPPVGELGFDELRIARRFVRERWDGEPDVSGWQYFDGSPAGAPMRWSPTDGIRNSGFAWCPLTDLAEWTLTPGILYALGAYGCSPGQELYPLDLLDRNVVSVGLHAAPTIGGVSSPRADLKGGTLCFWVGKWSANDNFAFYRYTRESLEMGVGEWTANTIHLTSHDNDWQLIAEAHPDQPKPLKEILADPQQWGIGIFGGTLEPTGVLGFDLLDVSCQGHEWNRNHDTNGWYRYSDAGQDVPIDWRPSGGPDGSAFIRCPLGELGLWEDRYYPLFTRSAHQKVNLYEKGLIRVQLRHDSAPIGQHAGFQGDLTVFVGHAVDENNYTFYYFKPTFAIESNEWFTAELRLTADEDDWELVTRGRFTHPLVELLSNPQQWGFAIVDAAAAPTGWLDFDDLRICPVPIQPLHARLASRSEVEITANGAPEESVRLEYADELSNPTLWRELATLQLDGNGRAVWIAPTRSSNRFFRARCHYEWP